jgi:hypothetical protein
MACFGPEISADTRERNHRFLEESVELVQACGCTVSEAHQLVDYTYGRPVGDTGSLKHNVPRLVSAIGRDLFVADRAWQLEHLQRVAADDLDGSGWRGNRQLWCASCLFDPGDFGDCIGDYLWRTKEAKSAKSLKREEENSSPRICFCRTLPAKSGRRLSSKSRLA